MTKPVAMNICPSEETLAAFIDGRLDPEARQRVIEHIVECAECRDIVMTAHEFQADEADEGHTAPARKVSRFSPRATFIASAVLAAAAVVIVVFGPMVRERWRRGNTGIDDLVATSGQFKTRWVDGRFAGGFPYRPPVDAKRGPVVTSPAESWPIVEVGERMRRQAEREPTPENLQSFGVSLALMGHFHEGIAALTQALRLETAQTDLAQAIATSENAALLNDIAVAYLERARREKDPEDPKWALQALDRALVVTESPEVLWNRALALEMLALRHEAVSAWQKYLQRDGNSSWATEARERIHVLNEPTVEQQWRDVLMAGSPLESLGQSEIEILSGRFPLQLSTYAEEELLPQWADAAQRHDPAAAGLLAGVEIIGQALSRRWKDNMILDACATIRRVGNDRETLNGLAKAHLDYRRGRMAYDAGDIVSATRSLWRAEVTLAKKSSPAAYSAAYQRARSLFMQNDLASTSAILKELRKSDLDRYPTLRGRVEMLDGLVCDHRGEIAAAFLHYENGRQMAVMQGADALELAILTMIADLMNRSGEMSASAATHAQAMALLKKSGDTTRRHQVLFEAAFASLQRGHTAAAGAIFRELASAGDLMGDRADACMTLAWHGVVYAREHRMPEAATSLDDAYRACRAIADPRVHERAKANLTLAVVSAGPVLSANVEITELTAAISFFEGTGSRIWLPQLWAARSYKFQALGRYDEAEADLRAGVVESERQLRRAQGPENRMFADTAASLYERLIAHLIDSDRSNEALEVAERAAKLSVSGLRDALHVAKAGDTHAPELDLVSMSADVSNDEVIVYAGLLSDRTIFWVITRREMRFLQRKHTWATATKAAQELIIALSAAESDEVIRRIGRKTAAVWIDPWLPYVPSDKTLVFVAGIGVPLLPVACSVPVGEYRWLLERNPVALAPSIGSFLEARRRDRIRRANSGRVLLVGASEGAPEYGGLEELPRVSREIDAVHRIHQGAVVVEGVTATSERVVAELKEASVVHYAGHVIPIRDQQSRPSSALVLTKGQERLLPIARIESRDVANTRLVVLSACSTGSESDSDLSFATGLLKRGVPSVVGTLWDVGDRSGEVFSAAFHTSLRAGRSRAAALRDGQRALLRSGNPGLATPGVWGAYVLIGEAAPL